MATNGHDLSERVLDALAFLGVAGLIALVLLLSVALGSLAWRTLFGAP